LRTPKASSRARHATLAVALLLACQGACGSRGDSDGTRELASDLSAAELRPAPAKFDVREAPIDGQSRPAIAVPPLSRITWSLRLPARAALHAWLAAETDCPARAARIGFRVGISDGRVYEDLLVKSVTAVEPQALHWDPVTIDLTEYSGFKWSLFYHPSRITWRITFNTAPLGDVSPDCLPRPIWGAPVVTPTG
jgi:hypothetical protein